MAETNPESILPALQADRDSEAGSESTMHIGDGSDSEDSSTSAFRQKVEQYGRQKTKEVLMAGPVANTATDKATTEQAAEDAANKSREEGEISSSIKDVGTSTELPHTAQGTKDKPIDADAAASMDTKHQAILETHEGRMQAIRELATPVANQLTPEDLETTRKALLAEAKFQEEQRLKLLKQERDLLLQQKEQDTQKARGKKHVNL